MFRTLTLLLATAVTAGCLRALPASPTPTPALTPTVAAPTPLPIRTPPSRPTPPSTQFDCTRNRLPNSEPWTTFTMPGGLQFDYPAAWQLSAFAESALLTNLPTGCIEAGHDGGGAGVPGWLHIGVSLHATATTPEQAFATYASAPGVTRQEDEGVINGLRAVVVTTTSTTPHFPLHGEGVYHSVLVVKNGRVYTVGVGKLDPPFAPVWERLRASLR